MPQMPKSLGDWNITILNKMMSVPGLEKEDFDFKAPVTRARNPVPADIDKDICAMSNTAGGTLVLGIDEDVDGSGNLLGYKKIGFDAGKEDEVSLAISNAVSNVEPFPKYELTIIPDGQKFYAVVIIESNDFHKPYFTKNKCQCFVRAGSASIPASRSTVLTLFSRNLARREVIDRLRTSTEYTRDAFIQVSRAIGQADHNTTAKLPPLDLTYMKNAILTSDWFLKENNLFGKLLPSSGSQSGIITTLHNLEEMNTLIQAFNLERGSVDKEQLLKRLQT
jgi:hypothetical protein